MTRAQAKAKMTKLVKTLPYKQLRLVNHDIGGKGCLIQRLYGDTGLCMYGYFREQFGVSAAVIFKANDYYAHSGLKADKEFLLDAIKSLPD